MGTEGIDPVSPFGGKLACEYSRYASGITSAGGVKRLENDGRIPTFEELLRFLLKWVIVGWLGRSLEGLFVMTMYDYLMS